MIAIQIWKKPFRHKEHKDHQGKTVTRFDCNVDFAMNAYETNAAGNRCLVHGVNSSSAIFVLFVLFVA
jgi:hypothetical protein